MARTGRIEHEAPPPRRQASLETDPPVQAKCPHCGQTGSRFSYSIIYREFGIRRVTHQCTNKRCRGLMFWDEPLSDSEPA